MDDRKLVRGALQSRRRGVRASRIRLGAALARAGLRTQAALAERIADREGLDSAPRSVVYRVFREQPVDVRTLARVADALDVSMQELLLPEDEGPPGRPTAQESAAHESATEPDAAAASGPAASRPSQVGRAIVVAAGAAVVVLVLAVGFRQSAAPPDPEPAPAPPSRADLSELTFAVAPLAGDPRGASLSEALRTQLSDRAPVLPLPATTADAEADVAWESLRLTADVLVDGQVMALGRHAAARLRARTDGEPRVFWVGHSRLGALEEDAHELAAAALEDLAVALSAGDPQQSFPTASAQEDYLRGLHYLDQGPTELNVRRAINRFEAALRGEEGYAAAHAGLCLALLQLSRMSSEAGILADAAGACSRAEALEPDLPVARLALGQLARVTGAQDRARRRLEAVLQRDPRHTDALLGLAEVALMEHRAGDATARGRAVELGRRAVESAPGFWKPPFTLARIHFFTGDPGEAVRLGEAAVRLDENPFTLANLGTSHLCRGDHARAVEHYARARALAPDASVGEEQMCVAYYFARRFGDAVEACRAALRIDSAGGQPAHHEMWGNLADAHRQAGQKRAAADAYARAAELAERTLLVKGYSPNDRAHLAYYYLMLSRLDATRVPAGIAAKLPGELQDAMASAADPQALIRIATAWMHLGELDRARAAQAAGTGGCPGFAATPDLDGLYASAP